MTPRTPSAQVTGIAVVPDAVDVLPGNQVRVDVEATRQAVAALVQAALRHGGLDEVECRAGGSGLRISPVTSSAATVLLGADLRDLGPAVAVRLVEAIGGSIEGDGDGVVVRLPA